jgi:hypothetical protein
MHILIYQTINKPCHANVHIPIFFWANPSKAKPVLNSFLVTYMAFEGTIKAAIYMAVSLNELEAFM